MHRLLLCLLALAGCVVGQTTYLSARLHGGQAVPPTASQTDGWALLLCDATQLQLEAYCCIRGNVGPNAAVALRLGAPGATGPLLLSLVESSPGTWSASGVASAAQISAAAAGGAYLELTTAAFPGGEIRGQAIAPATTRLHAQLTGTQVQPPNASVRTATALAFLHEPENRLAFVLQAPDFTNLATTSHVHLGGIGFNGAVLTTISVSGTRYCGVTDRLSAAQVAQIKAGGAYIDVHTNAFPSGEVRGQLFPDPGSLFVCECTGDQEVPPNASSAFASACVVVGPDGTVTVTGAYSGMTLTSAHVHLGPPGIAGPIVFPLSFQGGEVSGFFQATPADLVSLRSGLWYVNLHTAAYSGGEVRGTLVAATLPTTYGEGCPGTLGELPHACSTDFGGLGGLLTLDILGGPHFAPALLVIGASRSNPLPMALDAVGIAAPGCHALTDVQLTLLTALDDDGCAYPQFAVPLDRSLGGAVIHAQWALMDPNANAAGLIVSNGLSVLLQ